MLNVPQKIIFCFPKYAILGKKVTNDSKLSY